MGKNNRFRHQLYSSDMPLDAWHILSAGQPAVRQSASFLDALHQVGKTYRSSKVAAIFLVHGTFAGDDAFGLLNRLSVVFPELAERARRIQKQTLDKLLKDAGNYASEYAADLQRGLDIGVHLFHWSSENHHLARADAAVQLLDKIAELRLQPTDRLLLWGHSHGGNAIALLTNLLGGDHRDRRRFFRACRSYSRGQSGSSANASYWSRVQDLVLDNGAIGSLPEIDIVTFGTPIRYGWEASGYSKLLHFVHHHPAAGLPAYLTEMPRSAEEIMEAVNGDYIQHWGIAGTNLTPNLLAWGAWLADLRLGRLLQSGVRSRDLWKHLKMGMRVPEEGETLLVDYPPLEDEFPLNFAGHSVYTRMRWLPFHATEVARHFYADRLEVQSP